METFTGRNIDVGELQIVRCEGFHSMFSGESTVENSFFRDGNRARRTHVSARGMYSDSVSWLVVFALHGGMSLA